MNESGERVWRKSKKRTREVYKKASTVFEEKHLITTTISNHNSNPPTQHFHSPQPKTKTKTTTPNPPT